MTFRKFLMQWLMTTGGFVILAYLSKTLAPSHTMWPFALAFLYVGVLILLLCKAVVDAVGSKA